jgi:hypothetical protein
MLHGCVADLRELEIWRQIGVGIKDLRMDYQDVSPSIVRSICALLNEANHNTSIVRLNLMIDPFVAFPWIELLQNRQHLQEFTLLSRDDIFVEQSRILADVLIATCTMEGEQTEVVMLQYPPVWSSTGFEPWNKCDFLSASKVVTSSL